MARDVCRIRRCRTLLFPGDYLGLCPSCRAAAGLGIAGGWVLAALAGLAVAIGRFYGFW